MAESPQIDVIEQFYTRDPFAYIKHLEKKVFSLTAQLKNIAEISLQVIGTLSEEIASLKSRVEKIEGPDSIQAMPPEGQEDIRSLVDKALALVRALK